MLIVRDVSPNAKVARPKPERTQTQTPRRVSSLGATRLHATCFDAKLKDVLFGCWRIMHDATPQG